MDARAVEGSPVLYQGNLPPADRKSTRLAEVGSQSMKFAERSGGKRIAFAWKASNGRPSRRRKPSFISRELATGRSEEHTSRGGGQSVEKIPRAVWRKAYSVCLEGVKWTPEPSKEAQFYIKGTCHRQIGRAHVSRRWAVGRKNSPSGLAESV